MATCIFGQHSAPNLFWHVFWRAME